MNHYKIFVGVDVSKKSFTTTILYDDDRKLTFTVPNIPIEFEKKLSLHINVMEKEEILVLMEHTGVYHLALAEYLYHKGYNVACKCSKCRRVDCLVSLSQRIQCSVQV